MTEDDADGVDDADDLFDGEAIDGGDEIDDPFARLDGDASGKDTPQESPPQENAGAEDPLFGEAKRETADRDPVDTGVDDDAAFGSPAAGAERTGADDPFDELGPASGETDADLDDAFERMDVGGAAEEDVWDSLDDDGEGGSAPVGEFGGTVSEPDAAASGSGERFVAGESGVERVISKRTYCQQCPHFSAPPEAACGHEGTSILEAVGFDEFRVRNCPMVDDDDPTFDADRGE
ncbi:hypothetical protein [Halorubrum amylolyticum]|uniref:hypothetical protein n=1 Tax=Halorubrum amylolyticum TaxID=2508724 RepID=UPI00100898A8|nr:hypothetical protein [Halorubrum amylolyticum]